MRHPGITSKTGKTRIFVDQLRDLPAAMDAVVLHMERNVIKAFRTDSELNRSPHVRSRTCKLRVEPGVQK
ncbi:Hypothetical predicted protein [Xyrichtys novacula]|uniref:Uncharacterized protein n=1 Tax=Xyrichtys novacula TaxID=13765 RepID=A0AAV1GMF6_XYRNO|nr:Hypothetical predicted protein [Xyrichtys novacula]